MHTFIIIDDDIYTLDTVQERTDAAEALKDAGIERASVFRGGPEGNEAPEGRDFGADGQFHYDGDGEDDMPPSYDPAVKEAHCL